MSPTQDFPSVIIANRDARLEERVTAWVEDDPGSIGRLSHLEVPDLEAGFDAQSVRARSGRPEALRTCGNVGAGTRRHEV